MRYRHRRIDDDESTFEIIEDDPYNTESLVNCRCFDKGKYLYDMSFLRSSLIPIKERTPEDWL
jgi:hypothetical protein